MSLSLSLVGCIHFDRSRFVEADIRDAAEGADALFVEYPVAPDDPELSRKAGFRFPLFWLATALVLLLVQGPLLVLFTRGLGPTEYAAIETVADGRPVHEVDREPALMLLDRHPAWAVGNWLGFLAAFFLWPASLVYTTALLFLVAAVSVAGKHVGRVAALPILLAGSALAWWLLLFGPLEVLPAMAVLAVFPLVVTVTLGDRNEHMLDEIERIADEEGYDDAVLATGRAHLDGLVAGAADRGITVPAVVKRKWLREGETVSAEAFRGDSASGSGWRASHPEPAMGSSGERLAARAGAVVIDWVGTLVWVLVLVVGTVAAAGVLGAIGQGWENVPSLVIAAVLGALLTYHPIQEDRYGRSLGKRVAGLVVVDADDGSPPAGWQIWVRNLLRPVDWPVWYLLGSVVSRLTDGRRIGDLAAGTVVVAVDDGD